MANKEKKTRSLKCVITGRKLHATKEYYQRKVEKIGSEEKVHSTYVCREAKNLLVKGFSVEKIREMLNVNPEGLDDVSGDIVNEILFQNKAKIRRFGNIVNNSTVMNTKTDPDVKKFVESLKNE
jgi:hypothetical protein